jgi:hypothetical protein
MEVTVVCVMWSNPFIPPTYCKCLNITGLHYDELWGLTRLAIQHNLISLQQLSTASQKPQQCAARHLSSYVLLL